MKTILLVTEQYDPTADNLLQVLRRRGCPVLRWNLDRYPHGSTLTYRASVHGFEGELRSMAGSCRSTPLAAFGIAPCARGFPGDLKPEEREFSTREAECALNSLPAVTDWRWMNEPRVIATRIGSRRSLPPPAAWDLRSRAPLSRTIRAPFGLSVKNVAARLSTRRCRRR